MQADRRLVENVEHADQSAADLAGQPDALRFAAGQRRGGAVEREVIEAATLSKKPSRPRISLSTSAAIICRVSSSSSRSKNSNASAMLSAQTSGRLSDCSGRFGEVGLLRRERDAAGLRDSAACRGTRRSRARTCIFRAAAAGSCSWPCDSCSSNCGMMPSNLPPYFRPPPALRQVNVMCRRRCPTSHCCLAARASSRQGVSSIVPFGSPTSLLDRVGHALIDVPPPAADLRRRPQQFEGALP